MREIRTIDKTPPFNSLLTKLNDTIDIALLNQKTSDQDESARLDVLIDKLKEYQALLYKTDNLSDTVSTPLSTFCKQAGFQRPNNLSEVRGL